METLNESPSTPSHQTNDDTTSWSLENVSPLEQEKEKHETKGDASPPLPSRNTVYSDRLVASREHQATLSYSIQDANRAAEQITRYTLENDDANPGYALLLQSCVLGVRPSVPISLDRHTQLQQLRGLKKHKIFQYENLSDRCIKPIYDPLALTPLGCDDLDIHATRRAPRKIAKTPYKVLDAPALQDDFYLNLVDWSSSNVLAVGLGTCVYLWNASDSKVTNLCDLSPVDTVCSVSFSQRSTFLSVGTSLGDVHVWDVESMKKVHTLTGHRVRVGAMAWNSTHLTTGSRDRLILHHDIRTELPVCKFVGHRSEVCGLKWSGDDRQLASGGNDNQMCIWELRSAQNPTMTFLEHTAAVKAIAWSPHQHGLLASGGGTADRHIRFWNTTTEQSLGSVDTGSQVCNLSWSRNVNEIVSTHGYSQHQVVVWKYPDMTKLSTLTGHSFRVLYLAVSPDGQTIVTGAGDETLRFWSVFPPLQRHNSRGCKGPSMRSDFR